MTGHHPRRIGAGDRQRYQHPWNADPTDRNRSRDDELGLTRYCSGISAEVVKEWMADYPLKDAPEGYPELM